MSAFICTVLISLLCVYYLANELKLKILRLIDSNRSLDKSYKDLKQA